MKNRITKNPLTTITGAVIILASLASVFLVEGMTWTEATIGIGCGAGIMFLKDPKKKSDNE